MAMSIPSPIDGYVKDGLVLAYDGYQEPSGGVWKDLSGSGNDLTLIDGYDYDGNLHCFIPNGQKCYTKAVVPLVLPFTWEIVWSALKPTDYREFSSYTESWPHYPAIVMSSFALPALNTTSGHSYLPVIDASWLTSDDGSLRNLLQFTVSAGTVVQCSKYQDGAVRVTSKDNTIAFVDNSSQMCIGRALSSYGFRCFAWRIYNRALTLEELLQNRTLDITRFNL